MEGTKLANEILSDPAASFWIKDALRAALDRDPVDAANDAEVLAQVLCERWCRIKNGKTDDYEKLEDMEREAEDARAAADRKTDSTFANWGVW